MMSWLNIVLSGFFIGWVVGNEYVVDFVYGLQLLGIGWVVFDQVVQVLYWYVDVVFGYFGIWIVE